MRVLPTQDEGLDSWLEAIAFRYKTPFGDLADSVGLRDDFQTRWMIDLTTDELNAIADATDVDSTTVAAMTLRRFDGRGLRIIPEPVGLDAAFPWGRLARFSRSRYCPSCLAQRLGRWPLAWRLGWSFACLTHRCLLVDRCPRCGRLQRMSTHPRSLVPQPGHCALTINKALVRCGADLSTAKTIALSDGHPILVAQHVLNTVLADGKAAFGIYSSDPLDAGASLNDIAVIAARVAIHAAQHGLSGDSPAKLVAACAHDRACKSTMSVHRFPRRPSMRAPDDAVAAAVAAATAVKVLRADTISESGRLLRAQVDHPTFAGAETALRWGLRCSASLAAVQITAFGKDLPPALQLRYRASQPIPRGPEHNNIDVERIAPQLPSAMWPEWSIRFALPAALHQRWRPAIASAVLLVGSHMTPQSALERLGCTGDPDMVNRFLKHAAHQPNWASLSSALVRVADFLNTHQSPIDYDRRRALDYSCLLPDSEWNRVCVATGTLPGNGVKAEVARCYLLQMISGFTAHPSLAASFRRPGMHMRVLNFPLALTTQLDAALRRSATAFLETNHINEPCTWHPPLSVLHGLSLPRAESEGVDITALTSAAREANATISRIARRIKVSADTVRYLLERNPISGVDEHASGVRLELIRAGRHSALTAEALNELYCEYGLSIAAIARRYGTSNTTIARRARSQGIQIRPNGTYVDRDGSIRTT